MFSPLINNLISLLYLYLDNYVSGNGGGGSCGICVENCGNAADEVLSFFGLTGDSSNVESISNNNGAISYCKAIDSSLVCCGPKYTSGNGGVFVKNSGWYTDDTHGENGKQPDVGSADSGVCSYGTAYDGFSWLQCSGLDADTCTGGAGVEGASLRRSLATTTVFTDIADVETVELTENVDLDGVVEISCQTVTVNGNGFEVNGGGTTGIFHVSHASATFNDLTITNGAASNGGGVAVDGTSTVTFSSCTMSSNAATSHGGAFHYAGEGFLTLNMFDTSITDNTAVYGSGGGVYVSGTAMMNLVRTSFVKNTCHDDGGGLCVRGNSTKSIDSLDCSYKTNTAGRNGGGFFLGDRGSTMSSDTTNNIVGNVAGVAGGGFYIGGDGTSVITHYDCTVSHNVAGGFYDTSDEIYYHDSGTVELTDCDESSNPKGANGYVHAEVVSSTSCKTSETYTKGSRTCFSGEDMVKTEAGEKYFRDLEVGEAVLSANRDGELSYSSVVFIPHGENDHRTRFVELKTAKGKVIKMTRRHLLPICSGELMAAQDLKLGACLRTVDGDDEVVFKEETHVNGVYTAVTEQEFIVVNGIIASPFASPSAMAHAMYNETDVQEWCKSNNWLAFESSYEAKDSEELAKLKQQPSEYCEYLLKEMYEQYKDEPIGWGVTGFGYKGWKNPSSRTGDMRHSLVSGLIAEMLR